MTIKNVHTSAATIATPTGLTEWLKSLESNRPRYARASRGRVACHVGHAVDCGV